MNSVTSRQTSQTAVGALVVGALMTAGQPTWPSKEKLNYMVTSTAPSYSDFTAQVMNSIGQLPHSDFARDMAVIYASLSQRQERLGK